MCRRLVRGVSARGTPLHGLLLHRDHLVSKEMEPRKLESFLVRLFYVRDTFHLKTGSSMISPRQPS